MENIISSKTRIKFEIEGKIRKILENEILSESDIFYLFNLSRKLLDQLPSDIKRKFSLLKFYCDWMVHSTIDRSSVGALILEEIQFTINETINNGIKIKNFLPLSHEDIYKILSLGKAFSEFKEFIELCNLTDSNYYKQCLNNFNISLIHNELGIDFVETVFEILSFSPLTIDPSNKQLKPILERIRIDAVEKRLIVKQIAIIKLTPTQFLPKLPNGGTYGYIYWLEIALSDNTRIMQSMDIALG